MANFPTIDSIAYVLGAFFSLATPVLFVLGAYLFPALSAGIVAFLERCADMSLAFYAGCLSILSASPLIRISSLYFIFLLFLLFLGALNEYLYSWFDASTKEQRKRAEDDGGTKLTHCYSFHEIAVITGGSSGFGALLAEFLVQRGVHVVVLDLKLPKDTIASHPDGRLDFTYKRDFESQEIDQRRRRIYHFICDVGNRSDVERIKGVINDKVGTPTILVNNAAVVNGKQFLGLTDEEINSNYRVNLLSHYHTIQVFLPAMLRRPRGGTIVTVSSVLGQLGCAGLADYASAKAAQTSLHHSLRAELSMLASQPPGPSPDQGTYPDRIQTILITPGQMQTPLFSRVATPSPFLAPVLNPRPFAAKIANTIVREKYSWTLGEFVRCIDRFGPRKHMEISAPLYARWIGILPLLPKGVARAARWWSGIDEAAWAAFVVGAEQT